MELVKKTDKGTIYKKSNGRYGVKNAQQLSVLKRGLTAILVNMLSCFPSNWFTKLFNQITNSGIVRRLDFHMLFALLNQKADW